MTFSYRLNASKKLLSFYVMCSSVRDASVEIAIHHKFRKNRACRLRCVEQSRLSGLRGRLLRLAMSYARSLEKMRASQNADTLGLNRKMVFAGLFLGYCVYTVARRATVVAAKDLQQHLRLDNKELGAINSAFAIMYGLSKFFGGVASDFVSCRLLFAGGLFFAGVSNLLFPMIAGSLTYLCVVWGVNGAVQGVGWPSLSKILLDWFPVESRGSVWGMLTMSGNLGQSISPPVLSYFNQQYGWKMTFTLPGVLAVAVSCCCFLVIKDAPAVTTTGHATKKTASKNRGNEKSNAAVAFRTKVLTNMNFWLINVADVLVYFVLSALSLWTIKMLQEDRSLGVLVSSSCLAAYEAGGVVGTSLTGFVSDKLNGRRNLTSFLYTSCLLTPSLALLWWLPTSTPPAILSIVLFAAGFGVYGPKTLCGLAVRETHSEAAGTAGGFLGAAGQVGAALAGYPLGAISDLYGWQGVYGTCLVASFLAMVLFWLLQRNVDSKGKIKTL